MKIEGKASNAGSTWSPDLADDEVIAMRCVQPGKRARQGLEGVGRGTRRPRAAAAGWPPRRPVRPSRIGRVVLAVALAAWCGTVHAQPAAEDPAEPKLVLDTQGFTGRVHSLAFSPDRRLLAAAGHDKTVRIWDLNTGELRETLRGYHGIGEAGATTSLAFSPSGRELVVGVQDATTEGTVRVYDLAHLDQIAQLLPGHDKGVVRLAFSRDGRYLASAGADNEVILWDWPARRQRGRVRAPGIPSYLGFLAEIPVLIASAAGKMDAWSVLHNKEFARLLPAERAALGAPDVIQRTLARVVAMDQGMKRVALPYGGQEDRSFIDLEAGHDLRAGRGTKNGLPCYFVGLWSASDGRPVRLYEGHSYVVTAIALSPDGAWVADGDQFGEIHVWEVATGRRAHRFSGSGRPVYAVGFDTTGQRLAFGTKPHLGGAWKFNDYADLAQTFDFERRRILDEAPGEHRTAVVRQGDRQLATALLPQPKVSALESRRGGRLESRYTLPPSVGVMCASFLQSRALGFDDPVVIGRDDNSLSYVDPRTMVARRQFNGHSAALTAVAESPDGRFLASASLDRVLRIFSLENFQTIAGLDLDYGGVGGSVTYLVPGGRAERAGVRYGDQLVRMGGLDIPTLHDRYFSRRWPFQVGQVVDLDMVRAGRPYRVQVELIPTDDFVEPLLSLFIDHAGEWVVWTPQGYYDASPGGDRLIGWHVNQGRSQAAKFYLAQQFRRRFYRPDIIDRVLKLGDVSRAVVAANAARPRPVEALDLRKGDDLKRVEPPAVRILEPAAGQSLSTGRVTVRAVARSQNGLPITQVKVLVNGRPAQGGEPVPGPDDSDVRRTITQEVEVPPGRVYISVLATNRESTSRPEAVVVERARRGDPPRPKVYILAVGVSQYVHKDLNLRFAHRDAADFIAAWEPQKDLFYSGIETRSLVDGQASAAGIRDGLQWLTRVAKGDDIAMVFISSHGMRDASGDFYLGTHEIDPDRLPATAIPSSEFVRQVSKLPCKVLVFVDACHSGGLGARLVEDPLRELVTDEVGAILFASSVPREESLERPQWGHGAFSKAILDTLGDAASDLPPQDGQLSVNELEYWIDSRVQELTRGQQHPATRRPSTIPNFAVYRFARSPGPSASSGTER